MQKIILLFVLATIASCYDYNEYMEESHEYFPVETYVDKKCEKQGTLCKNCGTLVRCVEEEGGFVEYPVQSCNTTIQEYCWNDKQCSTNFNPECTNLNYVFKCTTTGIFPDPFNCKKYHICVKDPATSKMVKYSYACPATWSYNMVTTYCDISETMCPFEDSKLACPKCKIDGQSGALSNKSIWYLCGVVNGTLVPELHLCTNGKWYDGSICVPPNEFPTTPVTTANPTTIKPTSKKPAF